MIALDNAYQYGQNRPKGQMKISIRPANQSDYPSIAAIHNATWTDHPVSAEELERVDAKRTKLNVIKRFILEFEGANIAEGSLQHLSENDFVLELNVLPKFQARGFGTAFYQFLEAELELHQARSVFCKLYEIHPFALEFFQARGFKEGARLYHQCLNVAGFDFDTESVNQKLITNGYSISSFADLEPDPNWEQKLCDLYNQTDADVPRVRDFEAISVEEFKTKILENPRLVKAASFVAIKNDEWVGLSLQRVRPDKTQLHTGMTGVLREHRGQNLALALKIHAIDYATQHGFTELHSNNASTNVPMLAINQKLGFERSPAQIQLEKRFNRI
jgi:mycothiol synthase